MMTNANRRSILGGATILAALAALPAAAKTIVKHGAKAPKAAGDAGLAAVLKSIADALLRRAPEQATLLGLDIGANAGLASKLSDLSPTGLAIDKKVVMTALNLLHSIPRERLKGQDLVNYESLEFALTSRYEGEAFDFDGGPYIVNQQSGAYNQVPEFLDSYHRVENQAGVDAYLSRLAGFATQLDQETAIIVADAAKGVIPPTFIVTNALGQQAELRAVPAAKAKLVTSVAARAKKLGLADPSAKALAIVETKVYPALDRQTAALKALKTNDDAGVWKLPQGAAYYTWLLKDQTTSALSPDAIHAIGLRQNDEIGREMDAILVAQGITGGSVGERVSKLTADPKFLFPDTDAGRAECIAFVQNRIDAIRPLMPKLSRLGLKADVKVKRVPVDIQDGASLGYMNFASPDGKRPAIYYINLKSMTLWPKFQLASLTAHEALPGHAWQGAYLAEHAKDLPPTAQLIGFNAFVEGWALYAEQLVDEAGLYKTDPFARLGYLQAQRFRACRLVVDTGLHAMKWSREKAIDFLVANTGRSKAAATSEVDRYCASPAQACGYKIGHNEIIRQRDRAKAALGPKWDVRDFNDALVMSGGVPLAVLDGVVTRMIDRVKAA